nr:MAG TPA: hypothetical protein [Caudoviricetes sp.]
MRALSLALLLYLIFLYIRCNAKQIFQYVNNILNNKQSL